MATRTFSGGAPATRLDGGITGAPATFTVVLNGGGGFPTVGPFVVVIDRNLASEEKILVSSRTNDVFTIQSRGFDNSTQQDHTDQAEVEHVIDATILTYLVAHADNDPGDPHDQYQTEAAHTAALHDGLGLDHGQLVGLGDNDHPQYLTSFSFEIPVSFNVMGSVVVPTGTVDNIPPIHIPVPAGRTYKLTRAHFYLQGGTCTINVQKNGANISGWTALGINTTPSLFNGPDNTFADLNRVGIVVTAATNAIGLTCTLVFEVT